MQSKRHNRLLWVFLIVSFSLLTMSQAQAAYRQRVQRSQSNVVRPDAPPTVDRTFQSRVNQRQSVAKAEVPQPLATSQFLSKLTELCEKAKSDVSVPGDKELALGKARLLQATNELIRTIDRDPNRRAAMLWKERLDLDALKAGLTDPKPLEYAFVEKAWKNFNADESGTNWTVFDTVRTELQRYLVLHTVVAAKDFETNLPLVCANLIRSTEKYLKTADVQDAAAISDVLDWFDALTPYQTNLDEIVRLVRRQFSSINVQIQVALPFIAAGFRESFDETFGIAEQISGTTIRGTGHVSGSSDLTFVPRNDLVELKLQVNAAMESKTTGTQSPVTVNTETSGTLTGTKSILFSSDAVGTLPTVTKGALVSKTTGLRINGGAIVQSVARQQIAERRPAAEAEARRRAERRLSDRVDRQVDGQIAELNKNYQDKVRKPLLAVGFFPKQWNFLTTEEFVNVATLFAAASQITTTVPPPNSDLKADLIVRVHQSALNNAASVFLGGRTFYEDELVERFKGQTEDLPKLMQRKTDDVPINPTFAMNHPIAISFLGNEIKAVFRIADFNLEQRQVRQQSDITFRYGIKLVKETGTDGKERTVVVFEQLDKPRATAPGKDRISASEMAVQRRVMTRLEESVQKRIELQSRELKGRWEGAGKLIPVFASAENGWLTLAWNWAK